MSWLKSGKNAARLAGSALLTALAATSVSAQTNTFTTGSPYAVNALTTANTYGNTMGGMLVTWTFAFGGTFSASWGDIGGGNWGVSSNGFSVSLGGVTNSFQNPWAINNGTNNRLASVQFNGAPGRTLFDCDWNGTGCNANGQTTALEGTPGSAPGLSLVSVGGSYTGGVTGQYTNRTGVGGNAAVGDLYEQLTINFTNILGAQGSYSFSVDTDNTDFKEPPPVVTTPEPGTWAMMGLGLLAVAGVKRRRRA